MTNTSELSNPFNVRIGIYLFVFFLFDIVSGEVNLIYWVYVEDDLSHCNVGRCPGLAVNLITSIDFFSLIISRLVETTRSRARQSRATLSSLTARESQTWILLQVSRSAVSGQREWGTVGHSEGPSGHLFKSFGHWFILFFHFHP